MRIRLCLLLAMPWFLYLSLVGLTILLGPDALFGRPGPGIAPYYLGGILFLWAGCRIWLARHVPWTIAARMIALIALAAVELLFGFLAFAIAIVILLRGPINPG